jgi:hypothetical protein
MQSLRSQSDALTYNEIISFEMPNISAGCVEDEAEDVVYLAMILHDLIFFDTVWSNLLLRYMIHTKLSFIVAIFPCFEG